MRGEKKGSLTWRQPDFLKQFILLFSIIDNAGYIPLDFQILIKVSPGQNMPQRKEYYLHSEYQVSIFLL